MIVSELIKSLKTMDQNAIVVMSSDSECNLLNTLYMVDEMKYVAETTTSGRVYEIEDIEEQEYEDAVVLWP